MKFITKTLMLYRDLCYTTQKGIEIVETEYLWKYTSGIKHNELNPSNDLYLLDGQFLGYATKALPTDTSHDYNAIEKGKYLFLQGLITDKEGNNHALLVKAAEELYLESLWLEKQIINDCVFVRFLEEDGKNVFQLFRKIEDE